MEGAFLASDCYRRSGERAAIPAARLGPAVKEIVSFAHRSRCRSTTFQEGGAGWQNRINAGCGCTDMTAAFQTRAGQTRFWKTFQSADLMPVNASAACCQGVACQS